MVLRLHSGMCTQQENPAISRMGMRKKSTEKSCTLGARGESDSENEDSTCANRIVLVGGKQSAILLGAKPQRVNSLLPFPQYNLSAPRHCSSLYLWQRKAVSRSDSGEGWFAVAQQPPGRHQARRNSAP